MLQLAWRNIGRNTRRTITVICVIGIGLTILIFIEGLAQGFHLQMIEGIAQLQTGYIQIHQKGYHQRPDMRKAIQNPGEVVKVLDKEPGIRGWSRRIKSNGLINSARGSSGIHLMGIIPKEEKRISKIEEVIIKGKYLTRGESGILIGTGLADELRVDVEDKVVIMLQDTTGSLSANSYPVVGIFKSGSTAIDGQSVYISLADARKLTGLSTGFSEIALAVDHHTIVERVTASLQDKLEREGLEILSWKEILPDQAGLEEIDEKVMNITLLIVIILVAFNIMNTLILAVIERTREFGIMMSMGINPGVIGKLITIEAAMLSLIGTGLGLAISSLLILLFSFKGIPLAGGGEILWDTVIYPQFPLFKAGIFCLITLVTPILASIYPAIKASRIIPARALRFV